MRNVGRALAVLAPMLLTACGGGWFGDPEDPPLPGERISVLRLDQALSPDPRIADVEVRLPPPWRNDNWSQPGGNASHAMHHLTLDGGLEERWQIDVGEGSDSTTRLLAPPIIVDGRAYVMDANSAIGAFDLESGNQLWRLEVRPEGEEEGALGGGLAYDAGLLFATTGYGQVVAIEPDSGEIRWQQDNGVPFRAPPTASGGRVFAVSYDNQLHVLAAEDGRVLWTHVGIPEDAGLLGGSSPAVAGDIVVVPYSSGEIFAIRVETGRVIWGDQLMRVSMYTPLAALADIRGYPVIDRDRVLAISHSGRMAAIDLRTGERIWDRDIAGVEMPWVAGDFVYQLTTEAELLCLSRRDGRIRWVTQLQRFVDEEEREDPIQWMGPVLGSDRLVVVGSHGTAVSVSPYTGEILGQVGLPGGSHIPPVVADGVLYILTDDADLVAFE